MDGGLDDVAGGVVVGGLHLVEVMTVGHQRQTDLAGVDDLLELLVLRGVVAHEAHLQQAAALGLLQLHDLEALVGGQGQRLLAEGVFLGFEGGHDDLEVSLVVGGDDDGLNLGIVDHLMVVGVVLGLDAKLVESGLGAARHNIVDRHDLDVRDGVGQTVEMVRADGADADDADLDGVCHDIEPFLLTPPRCGALIYCVDWWVLRGSGA